MRGTHLQGMHLVLEGGLSMEHVFHCTVYCPTDTFHVVDDQVGSAAVLQMVLVCGGVTSGGGGGGGRTFLARSIIYRDRYCTC